MTRMRIRAAPRPAAVTEGSGWRVDTAGREIDRVPAARLEDELEHGLGVEVVELDRLPDPATHEDLGAARLPVLLEGVRITLRMHHAGDVLDLSLIHISEPTR